MADTTEYPKTRAAQKAYVRFMNNEEAAFKEAKKSHAAKKQGVVSSLVAAMSAEGVAEIKVPLGKNGTVISLVGKLKSKAFRKKANKE